MDHVEREVLNGDAEFFVYDLDNIERGLFGMLKESSEYLREKKVSVDLADAFKEWTKIVEPKLRQWLLKFNSAFKYLENHGMKNYLNHDLHGGATVVSGFLSEAIDAMKAGDVEDFNVLLKVFLREWERYYVALKDVLLRRISQKELPPSLIGEVKLDTIENVLNYFKDVEKKKIEEGSSDEDSQYKLIAERDEKGKVIKVLKKLVFEVDFEKLKKQLEGKKIVGNDGLTINLILNIFRNGLKDRIEGSNVYFDAFVEGDELVLRVMNDGKGIAPKHVQEGGDESIFTEGRSDTGSTGLGLANANSRVASAGGKLFISSERRSGEGEITKFSATHDELPFDLEEVREQRRKENKGDVNTIWEIRLKIVNK